MTDFEIIKALYFLTGFVVGCALWHFMDWRNANIKKHAKDIRVLKKSLLARFIRFVRGY